MATLFWMQRARSYAPLLKQLKMFQEQQEKLISMILKHMVGLIGVKIKVTVIVSRLALVQ